MTLYHRTTGQKCHVLAIDGERVCVRYAGKRQWRSRSEFTDKPPDKVIKLFRITFRRVKKGGQMETYAEAYTQQEAIRQIEKREGEIMVFRVEEVRG